MAAAAFAIELGELRMHSTTVVAQAPRSVPASIDDPNDARPSDAARTRCIAWTAASGREAVAAGVVIASASGTAIHRTSRRLAVHSATVGQLAAVELALEIARSHGIVLAEVRTALELAPCWIYGDCRTNAKGAAQLVQSIREMCRAHGTRVVRVPHHEVREALALSREALERGDLR